MANPKQPNTTTRSGKTYIALLTQTGTSAPTATILSNTIGNIVWTRSAQGVYLGTLTGAFPEQKTTFNISPNTGTQFLGNMGFPTSLQAMPNSVAIETWDSSGNDQDAMLFETPIQITVFN